MCRFTDSKIISAAHLGQRFAFMAAIVAVMTISNAANSLAQDWSQWMGSNRDNVLTGMSVATDFSKEKPTPVWRTKLAGGYSGPSIANGRLFITDYSTADDVQVANFEREEHSGIERVFCLNATTGEEIWKHEYPVKYTVSYPAGPRCTPTVDDDRVYTLGTEGNLICFNVTDGKILWSKNLPKEYQTKTALWGYTNHPLIDGDQLLCVAGGEGSHMVSFNKMTGEENWRTGTAPEQAYVPPTIIEAFGKRQLIAGKPNGIAGLNPETGETLWETDYEATSGSLIMSPIKAEVEGKEYLYIGGHNRKNVMLELTDEPTGVNVLWRDKARLGLSPVNVQPILVGDVIYGMDGKGTLLATKIPTGKRLWEHRTLLGKRPLSTGTAFMVRLGDSDRYLMFSEQGELIIGQLTPEAYTEIDRVKLMEPTGIAFGRSVLWSAPAYANGCMFVRNDKEIVCFKLPK